MATKQGDLSLLADSAAQTLLQSTQPAQLAYVWSDGTPRVIPIWFHWTGQTFVLGSPPTAPKVKALTQNANVALTINGDVWPYKVLLVRGTARVETIDGVVPEYAAAAERYFGPEQGKGWIAQIGGLMPQMTRIEVQPEWVGLLDFETRFPSAIEAAMAGQ
ncbi:MAG: pyridoxamine 5'-phosphate oxidase family protein [Caldilineaceae bacterium]|nr:pyridoxamine 5'-phosphate oxidase family protein [Caldilineaceae bacterium]